MDDFHVAYIGVSQPQGMVGGGGGRTQTTLPPSSPMFARQPAVCPRLELPSPYWPIRPGTDNVTVVTGHVLLHVCHGNAAKQRE